MDEPHPNLLCSFCGEPYGLERELVIVQSGEMKTGRKTNRPYFSAEIQDPAATWFHLDCFLCRMDFTSDPTDVEHCALCQCDLHNTRWVFRLRIGLIDPNTFDFMPFEEDQNVAMLCTDCALDGFGEGDYEEGELLLRVG